jgi:Mg/Co/Ni transporter MgtE
VEALGTHASAALLRRSSAEARQPVLGALPEPARRELTRLLASRPGTAGALADPGAIALHDTHCVADGLARLAAHPAQAGDLWLVDDDGHLTGLVALGDLLSNPPDAGLAKLRKRPPTPVPATAEREEIADHPGWQHHATLPVVDHRGTLVGQLRATDLSRATSLRGGGSTRAAKRTGRALAELYGLGLSGLVEWAAETARGGEAQRRRAP